MVVFFISTKVCSTCRTIKYVTEFYKAIANKLDIKLNVKIVVRVYKKNFIMQISIKLLINRKNITQKIKIK